VTSTVNAAITAVLTSSTYDAISTSVGIAVFIALSVLLFQRDVTRFIGGRRAAAWDWAFELALVPLLIVFLIIVAARLVELIV